MIFYTIQIIMYIINLGKMSNLEVFNKMSIYHLKTWTISNIYTDTQ